MRTLTDCFSDFNALPRKSQYESLAKCSDGSYVVCCLIEDLKQVGRDLIHKSCSSTWAHKTWIEPMNEALLEKTPIHLVVRRGVGDFVVYPHHIGRVTHWYDKKLVIVFLDTKLNWSKYARLATLDAAIVSDHLARVAD